MTLTQRIALFGIGTGLFALAVLSALNNLGGLDAASGHQGNVPPASIDWPYLAIALASTGAVLLTLALRETTQ